MLTTPESSPLLVQAAQGLTDYLLSTGTASRGVVIGYDHRARGSLCSHRFALLTTAALVSRGIPVYLLRGLSCTPLVPFGILHLGAAAGIMVTASHNPKQDNGYKVYGGNGSQIISPVDKAIAAAILRNAAPWTTDAAALYSTLDVSALEVALRERSLVSDPTDATQAAYFSALASRLCFERSLREAPGGTPLRVAYTAMHGVGTPFAARSFASFGLPPFDATPEQCTPDPEFSTVAFPNPGEAVTNERCSGDPPAHRISDLLCRGGQGCACARRGDSRPRRSYPDHCERWVARARCSL